MSELETSSATLRAERFPPNTPAELGALLTSALEAPEVHRALNRATMIANPYGGSLTDPQDILADSALNLYQYAKRHPDRFATIENFALFLISTIHRAGATRWKREKRRLSAGDPEDVDKMTYEPPAVRRQLRKEALERERSIVARETAAASRQPEAVALKRERVRAVAAAIAQLPAQQQQVMVLRYYSELSEEEIAAKLGISRGSVKTHSSRARAALRNMLAEYAIEAES